MHAWQCEAIDGPKSGWSCVFCSSCSDHLTHNCWMYQSMCLSVCLSVCLSIHPSIHPSIHLSLYLSIHLSIYPSICLSASLKTKLFCGTSSLFGLHNMENAAILRDYLNVKNHPIMQDVLCFLKLATSKSEAILHDFLQ